MPLGKEVMCSDEHFVSEAHETFPAKVGGPELGRRCEQSSLQSEKSNKKEDGNESS